MLKKVSNLPPVVRIEPAASCNLRCLHCPTGLDQTPKGIMEDRTFANVLAELALYGEQVSTAVLYHGGEPLLNPNLDKMIYEIKRTSVGKVKIVTNGKLLTPEWSEKLIEAGLDEIEISLDSVSPIESERIRRRSNATETIESIMQIKSLVALKKSNLKISISTTQFVDEQGIQSSDELRQSETPTWLQDKFPELNIKATWAVQWPGGLPRSNKIAFSGPPNKVKTCSLLEETITVRSNGDVVVCCYDLVGLSNLGNVNETPLSEIWNSPKYSKFRQDFYSAVYPEPCLSCSVVTGPNYLKKASLLSVVDN